MDRSPEEDQRLRTKKVTGFIKQVVEIKQKELERAREIEKSGFGGFDAVHLACAESGKADVFLTTDDRLLKKAKRHAKRIRVKVMNPLDWLKEMI